MNISFKTYDKLPGEAKEIRTTVFVLEQGFVDEFDDSDDKSIHVVMFDNNKAIGTSRIVYSEMHHSYSIGRFAILKEYRNKGLGKKLMKVTEEVALKKLGHIQIGVSSQEQASGFYEKVGYQSTNERYLDQNCPHVWMVKKL